MTYLPLLSFLPQEPPRVLGAALPRFLQPDLVAMFLMIIVLLWFKERLYRQI